MALRRERLAAGPALPEPRGVTLPKWVTIARIAASRPGYALKALTRKLSSRSFAAPEGRPFITERVQALRAAFSEVSGKTRGQTFKPGAVSEPQAELLWRLVRDRRPAKVVETGVCNGLSSAVILGAMEMNGEGELVSVDLPEFSDPALNTMTYWEGKGGAVIPAGREVGWLVPEAYRYRWNLLLGRADELLSQALEGGCDIFIHDSEHSYDNQLFEFRAGWRALRPGGVLVATDINWSDAFDDFCLEFRPKRQFVDHSCCLCFKR